MTCVMEYFKGYIGRTLYFSRSKDTLKKYGAVGISPVSSKGELPIRIEVHCEDGKPSMKVSLVD